MGAVPFYGYMPKDGSNTDPGVNRTPAAVTNSDPGIYRTPASPLMARARTLLNATKKKPTK